MKFILFPDVHLRSSAPKHRIDDYKQSMFRKIKYILDTEYESKETHVLFPGDIFDDPSQSHLLLSEFMTLLLQYPNYKYHVIFGQHDMKFRTKGNTALDVLIAGKIVDSSPMTVVSRAVFLYSCSYDEAIPEIRTEGLNILLIHKMIVEEKLWDAQADHEWGNMFLRRNKFDLIVSGDNHQYFWIQSGKDKPRHLINCGSLMRSTKAQIDYQPRYAVYETRDRTLTVENIPIDPPDKVFDIRQIAADDERDADVAAFIEGLSETKEISLSFKDNIEKVLKDIPSENVVKVIRDAMEVNNDK